MLNAASPQEKQINMSINDLKLPWMVSEDEYVNNYFGEEFYIYSIHNCDNEIIANYKDIDIAEGVVRIMNALIEKTNVWHWIPK